jgi:TonB family protein
MHRPSVSYPHEAFSKGIQGTVVLQVKLDAKGEVGDVSVLSGPDELRRAALQSVLQWHFTKDAALSTRQVSIAFQVPKESAATAQTTGGATAGVVGGVPGGVSSGVAGGVIGGIVGSVPAREAAPDTELTIKKIVVTGLSDQARTELLDRLPVREGDTITLDQFKKVTQAVAEFDEHLAFRISHLANKEMQITITAPGAGGVLGGIIGSVPSEAPMALPPSFAVPPGSIRVGGNVQQTKLVSQPRPVYPPLAKQARIQGVVTLMALIGLDGHVQALSVVKGHPLLVQAAMEAVQQWVYEPTLLNGNPVSVVTQIDVNFTLSQ